MGFEVGVIHHEHLFCPPTSFWLCGGASGSWGEDQLAPFCEQGRQRL